ncbi:MAG: uncharacterized protein KVP18_001158 [Porospora cf. gigantea A]|uniref:uncharacterized protein n=1 Tax=Porospora cf. gigantea A TaxID=2853593 RepID=UPI003559514D|nr:MAG: hypothetical protein KVP18_001158 [Porospora cf. gigantea A]
MGSSTSTPISRDRPPKFDGCPQARRRQDFHMPAEWNPLLSGILGSETGDFQKLDEFEEGDLDHAANTDPAAQRIMDAVERDLLFQDDIRANLQRKHPKHMISEGYGMVTISGFRLFAHDLPCSRLSQRWYGRWNMGLAVVNIPVKRRSEDNAVVSRFLQPVNDHFLQTKLAKALSDDMTESLSVADSNLEKPALQALLGCPSTSSPFHDLLTFNPAKTEELLKAGAIYPFLLPAVEPTVFMFGGDMSPAQQMPSAVEELWEFRPMDMLVREEAALTLTCSSSDELLSHMLWGEGGSFTDFTYESKVIKYPHGKPWPDKRHTFLTLEDGCGFLVFGGETIHRTAYIHDYTLANDLWRYDVPSRGWTRIEAGGRAPPPQMGALGILHNRTVYVVQGMTAQDLTVESERPNMNTQYDIWDKDLQEASYYVGAKKATTGFFGDNYWKGKRTRKPAVDKGMVLWRIDLDAKSPAWEEVTTQGGYVPVALATCSAAARASRKAAGLPFDYFHPSATECKSMMPKTRGCCVALYQDKLYIYGANPPGYFRPIVWIAVLDLFTLRWRWIPLPPGAAYWARGVVLGEKVWLLFGTSTLSMFSFEDETYQSVALPKKWRNVLRPGSQITVLESPQLLEYRGFVRTSDRVANRFELRMNLLVWGGVDKRGICTNKLTRVTILIPEVMREALLPVRVHSHNPLSYPLVIDVEPLCGMSNEKWTHLLESTLYLREHMDQAERRRLERWMVIAPMLCLKWQSRRTRESSRSLIRVRDKTPDQKAEAGDRLLQQLLQLVSSGLDANTLFAPRSRVPINAPSMTLQKALNEIYVLDHDRTTLLTLRLMHDVVRERGDTINSLEGELHRTLALTTEDRQRMQLTTQTAMVEVGRIREDYRQFLEWHNEKTGGTPDITVENINQLR